MVVDIIILNRKDDRDEPEVREDEVEQQHVTWPGAEEEGDEEEGDGENRLSKMTHTLLLA